MSAHAITTWWCEHAWLSKGSSSSVTKVDKSGSSGASPESGDANNSTASFASACSSVIGDIEPSFLSKRVRSNWDQSPSL